MARRPTRAAQASSVDLDGGHGEPASPVRRAPFSDNPTVGARGLRTQQRILDGALQVFGDYGYDRSTLDKIGQVAGCSRMSIYQYFAGKDDVFRHLAGQVARQLRASAESLDPLTPDAAGWEALHGWVSRYAAIFNRYEPVFRAFSAAAQSDLTLAGGSVRTGERNIAVFQSKLRTASLPPRRLDPVVSLLHACVTRSFDVASILREARPDDYTGKRIEVAITDVVHRALFGVQPAVNAREATFARVPTLRLGGTLTRLFERRRTLEAEATQPGRRALASLLSIGGEVVVRRGYQGTRVDDVVAAAGVSHGAFYRYFDNKDDFVHVVAVGALTVVSTTLTEMPDPADRTALRRWLRRYNAVHSEQGALIRVWVEAADDGLRADRAAVFDWGRRQAIRHLRDRPFGDVDADGIVLLALIEAFGSVARRPAEIDAAVHVIESGLAGNDDT